MNTDRSMKSKKETIEELHARTFLVTDCCMWEKNKKEGSFSPHSIEVVDCETGQTRYIKSGSRVHFIDGSISPTRDQETYNNYHHKPTGKKK